MCRENLLCRAPRHCPNLHMYNKTLKSMGKVAGIENFKLGSRGGKNPEKTTNVFTLFVEF